MKPWTLIDKIMFKIMRWLADKSANLLIPLKITHNQITFFGSMVFLPLTAFAFAQGEYKWNLLAIFFAFCHSYFDFIDGLMGRKTNTLNKLGAWSDPVFDLIGSGLIMAGVSVGVLRNYFNLFWLVITALAFFGHYAVLVMAYNYKIKIYDKNSEEFLAIFKKSKTNFFDFLIKEFIFLQSFVFLFLGTLRYSLIVFSVLNKLHYFVLICAIFSNLRWMAMFFAYIQALNQPGTKIPLVNLKVIRILRQFILPKGS